MLKMLERMVDRIRSGEPLHPASRFEATVNPFQIEMLDIRLCFNPQTLRFPKQEKPIPLVTDEMVNRFLTWPLPDSVSADGCATLPGFKPRSGTNLLSFSEAKAMLEHVLGQTWEARRKALEAPGEPDPSRGTSGNPGRL